MSQQLLVSSVLKYNTSEYRPTKTRRCDDENFFYIFHTTPHDK